MTTIREESINYVPVSETRNISELSEVGTELDLKEKEVELEAGESFSYKYIVVDGEEYRVPKSVLKQLKILIEDNKNLLKFRVIKKGVGMQTSYTCVPL